MEDFQISANCLNSLNLRDSCVNGIGFFQDGKNSMLKTDVKIISDCISAEYRLGKCLFL